jgi:hypothetical protein
LSRKIDYVTASQITHKRYEFIMRGQRAEQRLGAVVENIKRIPEQLLSPDILLTANISLSTETAVVA